MRLSDPIEASGYFWLPDDTKRTLPGILKISSTGRVELDVTSLVENSLPPIDELKFGEPAFHVSDQRHKTVVGMIKVNNSSNYVTLHDCYYKTWNKPLSKGIATSTIAASIAFIGVVFDEASEIEFSEFRFSFTELDEWLNMSGTEITHDIDEKNKLEGLTIRYSPPRKRTYAVPGGMNMEIGFDSTIPMGFKPSEIRVSQKARISLKSKDLRPFEEFRKLAWKIQNFLCFCTDSTISIDFMEAYSTDLTLPLSEGGTRQVPVRIYYHDALPVDEESGVKRNDMPLPYNFIEDRLEEIVCLWSQAYERFKPSFDLYFSTKAGAQRYIEGEFLSLVQGVESLHRRDSDKRAMRNEEYAGIVAAMLDAVPPERRSFFNNRLRFGNEPTLRERITEMFAPFEGFYEWDSDKEALYAKIANTRNYLTHFSGDLRDKAAREVELFELNRKLEVLLQFHFFRIIGMDHETITTLAKENRQIRWKLGAPI